jgi:AraC family transcriptional regulator
LKLAPILISGTLLGILAFATYLYIHVGGYKEPTFVNEDFGPIKIIFKHHIGAYHKILESIEPVEKWATEHNVNCNVSFGEYLDDPEVVAEDRLQSNGGCIVSAEPAALVGGISGGLLGGEISYREIPRKAYLIGEFDGAPSIGPFKVYPKAMKWMNEHQFILGGPVIEIYHTQGSAVHTQYLFPLGKK